MAGVGREDRGAGGFEVGDGASGHGFVSGFTNPYDYVTVLAQTAVKTKARLIVRYQADQDTPLSITLNGRNLNGGYDKLREFVLPASRSFIAEDLGPIELDQGDTLIKVQSKSGRDFKLDAVEIEL